MSHYKPLARRYRPQQFKEVLGQDAIVTTLKNAIKYNRTAYAYLFCGSRGTGKTTLARLFAKALNCHNLSSEQEPCNQCSSCQDIASGNSLDVIEIDGASNRGIDDVRKINETVGYATASGKYRIVIIDEVHMLTKDAFNALLKTLEEPPPKVKFFFATTEPHKVLPTILSRCQRFNLSRISVEKIVEKLSFIAQDLEVQVAKEALLSIAKLAGGGLRDAESLLDQILAFHEGDITSSAIAETLGIVPHEVFFEFDRAGKEGNLSKAFEIVNMVFSQGKDLTHFVESLVEHFRDLLLIKIAGSQAPFLSLFEHEREEYEASAKLYSREQCLTILDFLVEAQNNIRFAPSPRIALEALLMRMMRTHYQIPIEALVKRLSELEQSITQKTPSPSNDQQSAISNQKNLQSAICNQQSKKSAISNQQSAITVDPSPSPTDLGTSPPVNNQQSAISNQQSKKDLMKKQSHYDTLLQFSAVELEGILQKKSF